MTGRRDFGAKLIGSLRRSPVGADDRAALGIEHEPAIPGTKFELAVRNAGGKLPAAQVDGEEIPAGDRYSIDVAPRALHLIVPREHVDPSAVDRSGAHPAAAAAE